MGGHVKADCPLARDCPKKGAGKGRSVAPAGAKQIKKEDDEVSVRSNSTAATRADLEKALPVPVPVPQKCGFCGAARITPKHKKGVNACKDRCQSCFRLFK